MAPEARPAAVASRLQEDESYLTLLVLLNVASQGLIGLLSPLTEELQADLDIGLRGVGQIQALFLIVYAIATPFWAYLSTRTARHRLLIGVSALWGTCCFTVTFTSQASHFAIGFAFAALANAAILPLTFSMAIDVVAPARRGYAFGWLSTAHTLSMGLAFVVGGLLGEDHGWQLPFRIFSGLALASVIALLTWKRYEPRHGAMETELQVLFETGEAYEHAIRLADLSQLARPLANLWLVLATILSMVPLGAVAFWFIAMMRRDHDFDADNATWFMIALYIVQVPGSIIIGRISDWLVHLRADGKPLLLLICMLITVPCYGLGFALDWQEPSAASPVFVTFSVCLLVGAFVACGLPPLSYNTIGDINPPERRSVMFALINLSQLIGRAIGIQACTLISTHVVAPGDHPLLSPALAWLTLVFLPAALCLLPVIRSTARDRADLSGHLQRYAANRRTQDS